MWLAFRIRTRFPNLEEVLSKAWLRRALAGLPDVNLCVVVVVLVVVVVVVV